jgi:hypothetical protein
MPTDPVEAVRSANQISALLREARSVQRKFNKLLSAAAASFALTAC